MRKVDQLLEKAIELCEVHLILQNVIDERCESDIASFGTALLQSGLAPAVAMYSDSTSDAGKRRLKILAIVDRLLGSGPISDALDERNKSLLRRVLSENDADNKRMLRQEIMTVCIALKLAIRTFELKAVTHD